MLHLSENLCLRLLRAYRRTAPQCICDERSAIGFVVGPNATPKVPARTLASQRPIGLAMLIESSFGVARQKEFGSCERRFRPARRGPQASVARAANPRLAVAGSGTAPTAATRLGPVYFIREQRRDRFAATITLAGGPEFPNLSGAAAGDFSQEPASTEASWLRHWFKNNATL